MSNSANDFLHFERLEIEHGTRHGHTAYKCRIKSLQEGTTLELEVLIELPHSDKRVSELNREIAEAIHKATNPQRLEK